MYNSYRERKVSTLEKYLQQVPYLSSNAVCNLLEKGNLHTSLKYMKWLAIIKPEKYVFVPYFKGPKHQTRSARIYNREALAEDEIILEQYVNIIKNRCYGGKL